MCIVSAVTNDWLGGPNKLPSFPWQDAVPLPYKPYTVPALQPKQDPLYVTPDLARQMLDVITRLDEIDKKLNARECKLAESDKQELIAALQAVATQKPKRRKTRKPKGAIQNG